MKKIIAVSLLVIAVAQAEAQTFKKRFISKLEENLVNIQADWVSMDADTLLDFVIAGATADGQMKIVPYHNRNVPPTTYFMKHPAMLTGMKSGHMQVADWNRDGKMDLLISAKTLINTDAVFAFQRTDDYIFQKQTQKIIEHTGQFIVNDFNSDAIPDILTFGDKFIRVYKNESPAPVSVHFEATDITPASISAFDMNLDGKMDFVVSGHDLQDKPVTAVYYNDPVFKFRRVNAPRAIEGMLSLADINDDGLFDVIITGSNQSITLINQVDKLAVGVEFAGVPNGKLFTGDMTSDGQSDFLLSAKKVNHIRELTGVTTELDTTGLILQRMGDQDRDGDLDVIQLTDSIGSQWLKFYENTTPAINRRPDTPGVGSAISTYNKTFVFWGRALDDHTDSLSITYDVWLASADENIITPSYDLANSRRMVVRHGNAGTSKAMVINGLVDQRYYYYIRSVDNAYNGSLGVCSGGVVPCFDLVHKDVQACEGTQVKLAGDKGATWYSMSRGFLGKADTLRFVASVNDTIFSFSPQIHDCAKNRIFALNVNKTPPNEKETIYSCKGKTIKLGIAPGWSNVKWDVSPPKQNTDTITYVVNIADTVTATAVSQGCTFKKQFFIKISQPEIKIEGDGFQVLKGNSVQLVATGNSVETWKWDPPQGLSSTTISNPVATPSASTEYIVIGTDSVGCTATARTTVLVQETAFVPNLFTPNGDGKNDNIMIYGLTSTSRFNFKIFNREGSVVYETKDISQASSTGWNGFVQGTRQPSGIYYWKVDGETPAGDKLLLNGKTTGSILLVH